MKLFNKILSRICLLLTITLVGGVYATWYFNTQIDIPDVNDYITNSTIFDWFPSENSSTSENIEVVIDGMLDGDNGIGLNSPDSYLNSQIESRTEGFFGLFSKDTIGSMDRYSGDTLKGLFVPQDANISWLLHSIYDASGAVDYYELYTFEDINQTTYPNLFNTNGDYITTNGTYLYPVYKTKIVKINGDWVSQSTIYGYAQTSYYEETIININQIPSIDPDTFVEGRL